MSSTSKTSAFLISMISLACPTGLVYAQTLEHRGTCDASAAVAISPELIVVADDEDNILRVYRSAEAGGPVACFDLTAFLKPDRPGREVDIEGAAQLGDRIYWIGSHGRNREGRVRPARHRLFATEHQITDQGITLSGVGTPYEKLLDDLVADPKLKPFRLDRAAQLEESPEADGGLNIEGLAATPDGHLLIGFRNPIREAKALLVPLVNPEEVIDGGRARFGEPIALDLDGLGVRSIGYWPHRDVYLIVAGPHGDRGRFRLYQWSGRADQPAEVVQGIDFADLNPEALIVHPDWGDEVQILSDDGSRTIDGVSCRDLDESEKRFRSRRITP